MLPTPPPIPQRSGRVVVAILLLIDNIPILDLVYAE